MSRRTFRPAPAVVLVVAAVLLGSPVAQAASSTTGGATYGPAPVGPAPAPGGVTPTDPLPAAPPGTGDALPDPLPGKVARVLPSGLAVAPAGAPAAVAAIIAAGNRIAKAKYRWGGGHARWEDRGYDCSGSVSYALHGAGLLETSMPSGGFMRWGERGTGRWVTIYARRSHMYMVVAGLRFDTSGRKRAGTRWQAAPRSSKGFRARHPAGL